jgi:hypothetical protein
MRIRRSRRRLRVPPLAIDSAPMRDAWRARAGQDYVAFVDESFFKFFGGFRNEDGNFTHGIVALPISEVDSLTRELAPLVDEALARAAAAGLGAAELKFRTFQQLSGAFQATFAQALADSLAKRAGFVAAFYTSVRGLVMERVRTSLLGTETRVPDDHAALYDAAARELAAEELGSAAPGESWLIEKVLLSPVSGMNHFAAAMGFRIKFVYDPRTTDRVEDERVTSRSAEWMDRWAKRINPALAGASLGFSYSTESYESLGLQLADLVAGEARRLFRGTPALLKAGATNNLITETSREGHAVYWPVAGRLWKHGRVVKIPPATLRALTTAKPGRLWPVFNPVLASGILSCITDFGTQRAVMPYECAFMDGTD